jgi:hypothetical protein
MFCERCGQSVQASDNFCRACGNAVPAWQQASAGAAPGAAGTAAAFVAASAARGRIARHLRPLAVFWMVISAIRIFGGLAILFAFRFVLTSVMREVYPPPPIPPFVFPLMNFLWIAFLAAGVIGFAAGWGLLQREGWARILTLVLGVLSLLEIPVGTVLGIYTLWVLVPAEAEAEYYAPPQ